MIRRQLSRIGILAVAWAACAVGAASAWDSGPTTAFAFTRFDAGYSPGTGDVYFLGGRLADSSTDGSVWKVDPETGTTTDTGADMPVPISNYTMNLVRDANGWGFYVFCGRNSAGTTVRTVQVYYPSLNAAYALPAADDYPNTLGCSGALNIVFNDRVYVVGGFNSATAPYNHGETWVFNPRGASGSRWSRIATANLSPARSYVMGAALDGKLYAAGGSWFDGSNLISVATVEVLDPKAANPVWSDTAAADLPEVCSEGRAWAFEHNTGYLTMDRDGVNDQLIVSCGGWPDENANVYSYHPDENAWHLFASLAVPRRDFAAELLTPSSGATGLWLWGGRSTADTNVLDTSEVVPLRASNCDALLVDDDLNNGSLVEGGWPYYWTTLDQLGHFPTTFWHASSGTPSLATLKQHDAVIWFTGLDASDAVDSTDEAVLIPYLQQGGNLFLSATDQLWAHGSTPLMNTYFGLGAYVNDVNLTVDHGNPADPISSHLGVYTLAHPNDWDNYWTGDIFSDQVHAGGGAIESMVWETVHTPNALRKQGGAVYRTEFLAWPFEWVDTISQRIELMGNVTHWICPVLKDGFESGGTADWSRSVP